MVQLLTEPTGTDVEMSDVSAKTAQSADCANSVDTIDHDNHILQPNEAVELRDFSAKDLNKLPDQDVRPIEAQGQYYADIFHQLQIDPARYQEFYEGVVRACRQKHWAEVKRGTEKSYRHITALLLRAFGYIVWVPDSPWLLDDDLLQPEQTRLLYHRHSQADENERFYPILDQLWRRMRNILFAHRPNHRAKNIKHGQKGTRSTLSGGVLAGSDNESAYLGDADTDHHSTPITPLSPISNFRLKNSRPEHMHSDDSQTLIDMPESAGSMPQLTADEASEGILDLIRRLSQIRAKTNPAVFATLWEQHIGRVEEMETSMPTDVTAAIFNNEHDIVDGNGRLEASNLSPRHGLNPPTNLSNSPWITNGNPTLPSLREAAMLPPEIPSVIALYITTSQSSHNRLQPSHLYQPSQHITNVYHWSSAPILETEQSMHAFLDGVVLRVPNLSSAPTEDLDVRFFGWALSYGWNDGGCFIHTNAKKEGWDAFQADVRDAAIRGVRIWRVKVCVVISQA